MSWVDGYTAWKWWTSAVDSLTDNNNPYAPRETGAVSRGVPFSTGHSPRERGPRATSECRICLKVAFRIFHLHPPTDRLVINHGFGTGMQLSLLRVPGTATQVLSDFLLAGASGKGEFRSLHFLHFETSVHTSDTRGGFTIGLRKIIFCVLRKFFVFAPSFGQEGL